MLKVVLSVDTELWPHTPGWPDRRLTDPGTQLEQDYERCVLGRTSAGDFGLPFLLETLRKHRLRAVFFVEALFASAGGHELLERAVRLIQSAGQEVQLHAHTEWLSEISATDLPATYRQNLRDFNLDEQSAIVRHALANLRAAGALEVSAFRAGNMRGNGDTLLACKDAGLTLDMSLDPSRRDDWLSWQKESRNGRGAGCTTVPLSCVQDYPGHYRPAQLTALSFTELRHALLAAAHQNLPQFILLLHSFELVLFDRKNEGTARPHQINISRWNKLCAFLSQHRELFTSIGCADVDRCENTAFPAAKMSRAAIFRTLWRSCEQLGSRLIFSVLCLLTSAISTDDLFLFACPLVT